MPQFETLGKGVFGAGGVHSVAGAPLCADATAEVTRTPLQGPLCVQTRHPKWRALPRGVDLARERIA